MSLLRWVDQRRHWWKVFAVIFAVSVGVVGYIGVKTYEYAPLVCDFVDGAGRAVFRAEDIREGQKAFLRLGLMEYGSYLGDGGLRGPDFTAEALHLSARALNEYLDEGWRARIPDAKERRAVVEALAREELRENRHDPAAGVVRLTPAPVHDFGRVREFYAQKFGEGWPLAGPQTL